MNLQEFHIEIVRILNEWNPFQIGEGNYELEIADTVQAVHDLDNQQKLALRIQQIYEFSFEELLPLENCLEIAKELLSLKDDSSCSIF